MADHLDQLLLDVMVNDLPGWKKRWLGWEMGIENSTTQEINDLTGHGWHI